METMQVHIFLSTPNGWTKPFDAVVESWSHAPSNPEMTAQLRRYRSRPGQ
jgi:hypothetical protein